MPETTSRFQLRYPLGTERPAATQIQALAEDVDAALARHDGAWTEYEPTWFNAGSTHSPIAVGDGSLDGRYHQVGRVVHFWVRLVRGSTSGQGVNRWAFTLPVPAADTRRVAGVGYIGLSGYPGPPIFCMGSHSGTYGSAVWVREVSGYLRWESRSWSAGDEIFLSGTYEAGSDA